jgi:hypothetical protein
MSQDTIAVSTPQVSPLARSILMLIGTTAFEVAGLIIWVVLDAQNMTGLGLILLFVGLVLERLVIVGIPRRVNDTLIVLGSAWWEYAAWALWFTLIQKVGLNPVTVLVLVLFPGLHFQHAFAVAVKDSKSFGELARHRGFILFGLIEAVGGALWLLALTSSGGNTIPAHLIIIIAVTIEHIVQGIVMNAINQEGKITQMSVAH